MINKWHPRARGIVLGASISLVAALAVTALPASAAPPDSLSFSIVGGEPGGGNIELGTPQGNPVCTGSAETADMTCVTQMGISTSYSLDAAIVEGGTGTPGRLTGSCTVMYAGVYTNYWSSPGSADATGSEDCDLRLAFGPGDEVFGGMHQQRTLVSNVETSTFVLTLTRGTGRYAGFSGVMTFTDTSSWTAGPPLSESNPGAGDDGGGSGGTTLDPQRLAGLFALALTRVPRADDGGGQSIAVPVSRKPIVDVTSLGLLAPVNADAKVAVSAAAGSKCSGALTAGKRRIALPAKTVQAKGGALVLKSLSAGALNGAAQWNLAVTCTLKGKSTTFKRVLRTFEVLPG